MWLTSFQEKKRCPIEKEGSKKNHLTGKDIFTQISKKEKKQIAETFEGFNVVDSIGYYQGEPERSKIVTLIGEKKDILKAKELAKSYAKQFQQESVMIVVVPVLDWSFIAPGE